jgi:hypothetical protein
MDLNAVIDIIIKDLNEARDIIDDLKRYPGVPELQIELAKSKCKSASELITLLKNLPVKSSASEEGKSMVKEEIRKEEESFIPDHTAPAPEDSFKEDKNQPAPGIMPEVKEKQAVTVKKSVESTIIADQFSNRPESFNEKLGNLKHDDDVLESLKSRPLLSLDEAIGVNDRFVFIREIFNGDQESYDQAILKLESVRSLSDARAVIMSHTGEDTDNEALKQLLDLIKRKFPSNE